MTTTLFIYVGQQYSMREIFNLLFWQYNFILLFSVFFGSESLLHKNYLGPAMGLSAILLYLQSVRIPKYKWFFLGLTAVAVFYVQQANSGMGKALFVILIALLGFLRFIKRLPPRLAFAAMGMFLAIGISLVILITENAEYIIVEKLDKDMTLTGRTLFWPLIVDAINRQPVLGYGYGGFWQPWRGAENPALPIVSPSGYVPPHSHNGFLDMGITVGWLGLALFIVSLLMSIYYGVLYLTRSNEPEAVVPLVIFTWLVISNYTETGLASISSSWIFYVLMTTRLTLDTTENKFGDRFA
ncbi:O-antigen ligase [Coleofasciculus sp. LEGE 07081]|nr:O-antigen ligase family protein [Coleofasciculus sp. LEGE 07081]